MNYGKLYSFLLFLRLIDKDHGELSLTDIGTYIVLIKLVLIRQPTMVDLTALLAMLLSRGYRRYVTSQPASEDVY